MIGYWIQRHDYSSDDVGESNLAQTIKAFNDFDWEFELSLFQENTDDKDCPPGIGINNGKPLDKKGGLLLHICLIDKQNVFFSFHYQKLSSIFGINIGTSAKVHHVAEYPRNKVSNLIEQFYAGEHDQILDIE